MRRLSTLETGEDSDAGLSGANIGFAFLYAGGESGSAGAVPIVARGLPPGTLGELLQLSRDVEAIGAPPALLAAEIAPRLLMMSTPDDAAVFVITQHQIAMFSGLDARARARVLGGARDLVLGAP